MIPNWVQEDHKNIGFKTVLALLSDPANGIFTPTVAPQNIQKVS